MSEWEAWIGREEVRADRIDAGMLARWCATLDREPPLGGSVPQGVHWCLGLPDAPTATLGADGHPLREDGPHAFLPPVPLPRRMWAGSTIEFHRALRVDEVVERRSRILAITPKHGASGPLAFVDVEHETRGNGAPAVREVQSIVYREAAPADAPPAPPPLGHGHFDSAPWEAVRTVEPDAVLLFRYSALTFNGHRIHYDYPYATGVERYRGLVVHGPLIATLLLDLARRKLGDNVLQSFAFRALSPTVPHEPVHLGFRRSAAGYELGAYAADGRAIMGATAT